MQLRRLFQFRLRTLLIVATLCCVALVIFVLPARRQRQTVLELKRRGAGVRYERERGAIAGVPPTWSQTWLGCDFGQRVYYICFLLNDPAFTESDWRRIETCPPEELWLSAKEQGDRDLARAAQLPALKRFYILNPSLTDQGLLPLQQLPQLEHLVIQTPLLTDAGLAHLAALSKLQNLTLIDTQITAKEVAKLRQTLPQCTINLSLAPTGGFGGSGRG